MVSDKKNQKNVVLTKPLSLEADSDADYRVPNLFQRVWSLFKSLRPGSDLTRFQLPPLFNLPKSHLQCYGESVYCISNDILSKCNSAESPLERLKFVVEWSISTTRPIIFGVAPYNPILGETHHVSRGNLNVLLEQISHHPPVSALHATDEKENFELIWCQHPLPRFTGASVETDVQGKRELKLWNRGETYVVNSPRLLIKFLPVPDVEWVGNVRIQCKESGLEAEICYRTSTFFGRRRAVRGKIFESSSCKTLCEIDGHWDRTVTCKDLRNRKVTVLYNSKQVISGVKSPTIKDLEGVSESESAFVWGEVSKAILSKDWEKAREAKDAVETRQRKQLKEREEKGETWVPKHFNVSMNKESGWDCSPVERKVPPAPIIVPL